MTAAAVAALAGAVPAMAQSTEPTSKTGIYGNLGWNETQVEGANTGAINALIGGRWGNYLGVEGELNYGLSSGDRTFGSGTPGQTNVNVKQKLGGAVYGVGFLPLGDRLDLLARVGWGKANYRISPTGHGQYTASESGIRYGAGAQYILTGATGVRLDWTRQHMGSLTDSGQYFSGNRDANVWSVALTHKF
jgi:hypothetical protein